MSEFEPILSNPYLGYRLDPYEPGFIRHAKASQSTSQVVSHENRNLTRLCRQAVDEDRIVIKKQITYRPIIAGSYMGIAAGKTTVVSMEKQRPEEGNPAIDNGNTEEENPSKEPSNMGESDSTDSISEDNGIVYNVSQPKLDQLSAGELNQEEQDLRVEIRRINNEMEKLEREKAHSSDDLALMDTEQNQAKLELELERKKRELQNVTLAKVSKLQSELFSSVNQGVINSYQASMGMLKLAYSDGNDSSGQSLNLFI